MDNNLENNSNNLLIFEIRIGFGMSSSLIFTFIELTRARNFVDSAVGKIF